MGIIPSVNRVRGFGVLGILGHSVYLIHFNRPVPKDELAQGP